MNIFRSFKKHKGHSLVNLFGLTVGISAALFIWQYISFEMSYDSFFEDSDRIYRVVSTKIQNGNIQPGKAQASVILKNSLENSIPEIEAAARIHPFDAKKIIIRREKKDCIFN